MCLLESGVRPRSQRPSGWDVSLPLWAPQQSRGALGEATVRRAGHSARLEGGHKMKRRLVPRKGPHTGPQAILVHVETKARD